MFTMNPDGTTSCDPEPRPLYAEVSDTARTVSGETEVVEDEVIPEGTYTEIELVADENTLLALAPAGSAKCQRVPYRGRSMPKQKGDGKTANNQKEEATFWALEVLRDFLSQQDQGGSGSRTTTTRAHGQWTSTTVYPDGRRETRTFNGHVTQTRK